MDIHWRVFELFYNTLSVQLCLDKYILCIEEGVGIVLIFNKPMEYLLLSQHPAGVWTKGFREVKFLNKVT